MTTTTPSRTDRAARRRGFTLVEVMIGAALSSFILAGVLSSFLFLGRSGANVQNYNDMESQARKALEIFAEDVRQASSITWNSSTSITLTVNAASVLYAYDGTARTFVRRDAASTRVLISGVTPGSFSFKGYTITGTEIAALSSAAELAYASNSTKQLQISLAASRTNTTVVAATNTVLSARFILRNKIVTA
ncbi:MAG: prepilin-type N-terminal cleavage/methylation domain-containing protein [Opitutaceae bacterium]|nr:prepilin-type N-terminal cleavage/methylation domain-containing protein [Opitutaceae bacterium]